MKHGASEFPQVLEIGGEFPTHLVEIRDIDEVTMFAGIITMELQALLVKKVTWQLFKQVKNNLSFGHQTPFISFPFVDITKFSFNPPASKLLKFTPCCEMMRCTV